MITGSSETLLGSSVLDEGTGLTAFPGSQGKPLDLHENFIKHWGGQTKLMCGWMWHPAHQFEDSTLHKENTHPEMISLVSGKAGTPIGLSNWHSFRALCYISLLLQVSH